MVDLSTPESAQAAFYRAFESADIETMMDVWAEDDDISCIHPMGKILQGTAGVREGWQQIFAGDQKMHFELEARNTSHSESLVVYTVIEHIYLHGESKPRPPIVATNVYRRMDSGWRMILHHASPSVIDATGDEQTEPTRKGPLH